VQEVVGRQDGSERVEVPLRRVLEARPDDGYGADLTIPEIAKLTGESLTTAEGRVCRALRKLG